MQTGTGPQVNSVHNVARLAVAVVGTSSARFDETIQGIGHFGSRRQVIGADGQVNGPLEVVDEPFVPADLEWTGAGR